MAAQTTVPDSAAPPIVGAEAAAVSTSSPPPATTESAAVSQVRIVRLSQVRGVAMMDRTTGHGFETAFANIPVVQGVRLHTERGVAEVEFEDNSSLRLTPDSEVQFTTLCRNAVGGTITVVDLVKGMVFVDVQKTRGNEFVLLHNAVRVILNPGTRVRIDATGTQGQLAVFDGSAAVVKDGTNVTVSKHETLELNPPIATLAALRHGTDETDWDAWDRQEASYHRQKAASPTTGGFGLYGANDLNYYGSFASLPGCGSAWRPYFASAAWDPFANGVWAWYPTAGYSWVSPYPWGWLPYHSGSWVSCGAAGWGWQPGGQWYGLNNTVAMRIARHPLHPVPSAPTRTSNTLVPVNMKPLTVSGVGSEQAFTFRRDSAGLGVPRAVFGNLHGFASAVAQRGTAQAPPLGAAGASTYAGSIGVRQTLGPQTSASRQQTSSGSMTRNSPSLGGMSGSVRSAPMTMPSAAPAGGSMVGSSHK